MALAHSASGFSLIPLTRAPLILAVILTTSPCRHIWRAMGVSGLRDLLAHGAKRALARVKPGIFYKWAPELAHMLRG